MTHNAPRLVVALLVDTVIVEQLGETLAQIVGADHVLKEAEAVRFSGGALGFARGSRQFAAAFLAKGHGGWAARGLRHTLIAER